MGLSARVLPTARWGQTRIMASDEQHSPHGGTPFARARTKGDLDSSFSFAS